MSRKRPKRVERRIATNNMGLALCRAARHTADEIATMMAPKRALARAFREGVATEQQYNELRTSVLISLAIEGTGVVRGLQGHFLAAIRALDAVAERACAHGPWQPRALRFDELDAINAAVDLFAFQLRTLSAGELHQIVQRLVDQASARGEAIVVVNDEPAAAGSHHHEAAHAAPKRKALHAQF